MNQRSEALLKHKSTVGLKNSFTKLSFSDYLLEALTWCQ